MKQRLDQVLVQKRLVPTRSQAESYIRLGKVTVNKNVVTKPGTMVSDIDSINLLVTEQYVGRAGMKLASVAATLHLDFRDKVVLDVGSSTGGFTDYSLKHGAKRVIAVDVGTDQLHPSLRGDARVELYEKTDIRELRAQSLELRGASSKIQDPNSTISIEIPDLVLIDVSFISLRDILPHVATLTGKGTSIVAMVKPQFEAGKEQINKGVIKNDSIRRAILRDFETWVQKLFVIIDKADSEISGAKGNKERFYLLKKSM